MNEKSIVMSMAEFIDRLELPARPTTIDVDWFGDVDPAGVTIYLESE